MSGAAYIQSGLRVVGSNPDIAGSINFSRFVAACIIRPSKEIPTRARRGSIGDIGGTVISP